MGRISVGGGEGETNHFADTNVIMDSLRNKKLASLIASTVQTNRLSVRIREKTTIASSNCEFHRLYNDPKSDRVDCFFSSHFASGNPTSLLNMLAVAGPKPA